MKRKSDKIKKTRKSYTPIGESFEDLKKAVNKAHDRLIGKIPFIDRTRRS